MLNPSERETICGEFKERISSLMSDIEDSFYQKYTTYGQNLDKDAPFINKLFKRVKGLYDFISEHHAELENEAVKYENEQSNLDDALNAWNYGLCPRALKEYRIYFYSDMEGVKKFKAVTGRANYEQTVQAIKQWQASKRKAM